MKVCDDALGRDELKSRESVIASSFWSFVISSNLICAVAERPILMNNVSAKSNRCLMPHEFGVNSRLKAWGPRRSGWQSVIITSTQASSVVPLWTTTLLVAEQKEISGNNSSSVLMLRTMTCHTCHELPGSSATDIHACFVSADITQADLRISQQ